MAEPEAAVSQEHKGLRFYLWVILGVPLAAVLGFAVFAFWLAPPEGDLVRIGGWSERNFGWQGSKTGFVEDHFQTITINALLEGDDPGDILVFGDSFSNAHTGGISWMNTLHALTGHSVQVVKISDFQSIQIYLESDAFQTNPPAALILQTVERAAAERAMGAHRPNLPCTALAPARGLPARQSAPLDLATHEFTLRTSFASFDEVFAWGTLSLRTRLMGQEKSVPVTLTREDLFTNRASGHGLIFFDDIKNYTSEAFLPDTLETVQSKAVCGLRQLASQAREIPFRVVVAPDKLTIYASWISTPFPAKEIDVFAMANLALGNTFIDLRPTLTEAAKTIPDIYYPSDTHWGPKGHQFAGQVIGKNLLP